RVRAGVVAVWAGAARGRERPPAGLLGLVAPPAVDQGRPLLLDGDVRRHLGLANLALLLLDGDLGGQLALLDAPLLLYGGVAAGGALPRRPGRYRPPCRPPPHPCPL